MSWDNWAESLLRRILKHARTQLLHLATPWEKEQLDWAERQDLLTYRKAAHPGFVEKYGPSIWGKDTVYDLVRFRLSKEGLYDVVSIYVTQWGELPSQIAVAIHIVRELGYPPARVEVLSDHVDIEVFEDDAKEQSLMHVEVKRDPQELEESINETLRKSIDDTYQPRGLLYDRLVTKKPKYALWASRPEDGSADNWDAYIKRVFNVEYYDDGRAQFEEISWDKVPKGPGWATRGSRGGSSREN